MKNKSEFRTNSKRFDLKKRRIGFKQLFRLGLVENLSS